MVVSFVELDPMLNVFDIVLAPIQAQPTVPHHRLKSYGGASKMS
jgi:hypothetical protein